MQIQTLTRLASSLALSLALVACTASTEDDIGSPIGGGRADAGADDPSGCNVAAVPTDILVPRCGACHGADAPAAGVDLVSANVAARLVDAASSCDDAPLVVAGDAAGSYLVDKLGSNPACGLQMPRGGTPLSADEIECVSRWVNSLTGGGGTGGGGTGGGGTGGGGTGGGTGGGW